MLLALTNGRVIKMVKKDYTEVIKKIDLVAAKIYDDLQKTDIP